jgi:hypothetical protein
MFCTYSLYKCIYYTKKKSENNDVLSLSYVFVHLYLLLCHCSSVVYLVLLYFPLSKSIIYMHNFILFLLVLLLALFLIVFLIFIMSAHDHSHDKHPPSLPPSTPVANPYKKTDTNNCALTFSTQITPSPTTGPSKVTKRLKSTTCTDQSTGTLLLAST